MLGTERLLLHALSPADAAALLAGHDPASLASGALQLGSRRGGSLDAAGTSRWHPAKGWPHQHTFDALRTHAEHGDDVLPGPWLVLDRESLAILGEVGWHGGPDAAGTVEVGYGLSPAVHGRGYGTEAVRAWCEWAAARDDVRRIVADVLPGNTPSIRLLVALGFTPAGTSGTHHLRYERIALAGRVTST